jgi:hypothetical protein
MTMNDDLAPARPKSHDSDQSRWMRKRIIEKGDSRKPRWWRVNVGKRFTGTSKQRRFFDTEADAVDFIRATEDAARDRGKTAFNIPQALALEAIELSKQLRSHGATLTDAVKFYLRNAPINGKKTVKDLIPEYLKTKNDPRYRRAQETSLNVFAKDFGGTPVASVSSGAVEKWFEKKAWQPLNARNYMRDLSMFFRWAELRDHTAGNPFDKVKRPHVERKAPEIFTVEEARKLLEAAHQHPG